MSGELKLGHRGISDLLCIREDVLEASVGSGAASGAGSSGASEDVAWIEQVVTKARDLEGNPPAVLVSSSGFSAPAREKAGAYGHDVCLVTKVTLEELRFWFQVEHVVLVVTERRFLGCDIELTPEDADGFAPALSEALANEGFAAPIFERSQLGPLSAKQLFDEWYKKKHG